MTKTQKILWNIVAAQVASDSGKNITSLWADCPSNELTEYAWQFGYAVKADLIAHAIDTINATPRCGINYYVEQNDDQNGYPSIIVYFDIKNNGTRYQVSFHTPENRGKILVPYLNKGRKTRWAKHKTSSHEVCERILKEILTA